MIEKRSLQSMQEEVDTYIQQFKAGYFSPLSQMARLTEEVGELAREVNHTYGEKPKKTTEAENSVAEELGDVLFVTLIMANSLGIDLTDIFEKNMAKFNQRDRYRFERVDGQTQANAEDEEQLP
ncbi:MULTISPECIES: nucleotide pyrophosphohydrolase [Enterococcus]|uniref:nucleotide pyrophosphohydrolase n=1 Tax=Enterococcus TaxID=1350 RepID=UPI001956B55B|nr:nucleotide pyrophosphohydrolase [Enterococcus diestrammenae]HIX70852.1 nucleotide pyrophosphohydrolase [Candidatus Enterococcus stercoravium]